LAEDEVRENKSWAESLGAGQIEGDRWYHLLFKGFFPPALYVFSYFIIVLIYGSDMASRWVELTTLFVVPPFGTATIVPWGMSDGFSGLTMAFTVAMVDFVIAMLIVWWFVLLKKIPYVGKIFVWTEKKAGEKIEANPQWKRGTWWVIFCTLLIPIQGSGGMNMSVIGKLIGLRADTIVSAVVAGSLTIALFVAFFTNVGMFMLSLGLGFFIVFILIMIQGLSLVYILIRRFNIARYERELAQRT
jgi:hypothetical protein